VRLTRRGRLAAVVLALLVLLVATAALGRSVVAASTGHGGTPALATVVVEPGQTLWQLARTVAPHADPRDTVIRLERLNGLDSPVVRPGQQLLIPAR
jgi:LysM repeat protein